MSTERREIISRRDVIKNIFITACAVSGFSIIRELTRPRESLSVSLENVKKVSEWIKISAKETDKKIISQTESTTYSKTISLTTDDLPHTYNLAFTTQNNTNNTPSNEPQSPNIFTIQKLPVEEGEKGFTIIDNGANGLRENDSVIITEKVGADINIIETFVFPENDQTENRVKLDQQYDDLLQQIIDTYNIDDATGKNQKKSPIVIK